MTQSLGDRMKRYEEVCEGTLTRRVPALIRVDGRAFHTLTRNMDRPYSDTLHLIMRATAHALMQEIQAAKLAYCQSDEISVVLTDYDTISTDPWFGYRVQTMASIAAAVASTTFTQHFGAPAHFDARVFTLPKDEVANYFVWRQKDATRNSIQMLGRAYFSHKALMNKGTDKIQEMLHHVHGVNWNDVPTRFKRGWCANSKGTPDIEIPIFTQDRDYIERHVFLP